MIKATNKHSYFSKGILVCKLLVIFRVFVSMKYVAMILPICKKTYARIILKFFLKGLLANEFTSIKSSCAKM
jgi:predicted DNA-binding transcriptional regulator